MSSKKTIGIITFTFLTLHAASFGLYYARAIHASSLDTYVGAGLVVFFLLVSIFDFSLFIPLFIGELFTGGNGALFEYRSIALRTVLLFLVIALWGIKNIRTAGAYTKKLWPLGVVGALIAWGALHGYLNEHNLRHIYADTIIFAFLLLAYPLAGFFEKYPKEYILKKLYTLTVGAGWGILIGTLITFALYASGHAILQETYYDWLRNVLAAKITFLGDGFYRIVFPFFLPLAALTPWIFFTTTEYIHGTGIKNKLERALAYAPFFVLPAIHLTRGLVGAVIVSIIALGVVQKSIKKTIIALAIFCSGIFISFALLHGASSHFTSFGLEKLAGRGEGITQTGVDESTDVRRLILPLIVKSIKEKPLLGHGIGSTVTFDQPIWNQPASSVRITKPDLDWGYLEIIRELGILGACIMIGFAVWFIMFVRKSQPVVHLPAVSILTVLLVSEVVMQSIFHIYGMLLIGLIIALAHTTTSLSKNLK